MVEVLKRVNIYNFIYKPLGYLYLYIYLYLLVYTWLLVSIYLLVSTCIYLATCIYIIYLYLLVYTWLLVIHSFIHCRHLYSASSSGATQKRYLSIYLLVFIY